MKYEELIELVLQGRSVNATAKAIGLPQRSLDEYVKAKNLPDCERAVVLARAAGVSIEDAVLAIVAKKAELRPERVHSFLRPAMASVLAAIVAVNLFLTPQNAQAAPANALPSVAMAKHFTLCKIMNCSLRTFKALFVAPPLTAEN